MLPILQTFISYIRKLDIFLYLTPLGQARQFIEYMVHKIPSVEGNLLPFGLICYFCPDSQIKQHLDCPM
jgi:hypothetical protein